MSLLANALGNFIQFYVVLLIVRILLGWFNVDWFNPPFSILSQITDPYLNIFRRIVPPIGGMDFSPILAIFLLQFVGSIVSAGLASLPV